MPEITLKKNTIYLNKYIRTETDRTTFFICQKKKLVLASKDKERAATGGVRRHAPPETPFL